MLISIGYSACHWCHVMERETFENENTAVLMNTHFVCIKVDREERPDVDQIYMDAVQLITGRGGWPLNVFTLPDGRPIHGGTYFPNNDWNQLLFQLSDLWHKKPDDAVNYAEKLTQGVRNMDVRKELAPEQKAADLEEIFTGFRPRLTGRMAAITVRRNSRCPIPTISCCITIIFTRNRKPCNSVT